MPSRLSEMLQRVELLSATCLVLIGGFAMSADATWGTATVDNAGDRGRHAAIAIDANGDPHISYYNTTNGNLMYVSRLGPVWHPPEVVDAAADVGEYTSLVLDSQGRPHISYFDKTNEDLKYAVKSCGDWIVELVDRGPLVFPTGEDLCTGQYTSIALDSQENPHISYYECTNGNLRYARKMGGSWSRQTAVSADDVGRFTSLALDAQDDPHISCWKATSGDLMYVHNAGGVWLGTVLDAADSTGRYTSLKLDDQGDPHIAYRDDTSFDVAYAFYSSATATWTLGEIVDGPGSHGWGISLDLDSNGTPHVAYRNASQQDLKYATRIATDQWRTETVDGATTNVGSYPSLSFDASDNAHIAYYDATNSSLKYASSVYPPGSSTVCVLLSANVVSVSDPAGLLGGTIQPGEILRGGYMYDIFAVDADDSQTIGVYRWMRTPADFWLWNEDLLFETRPTAVDFKVRLGLEDSLASCFPIPPTAIFPPYFYDVTSLSTEAHGLQSATVVETMSWHLRSCSASVLQGDALPRSAPRLDFWECTDSLVVTGRNAAGTSQFVIVADATEAHLCNSPPLGYSYHCEAMVARIVSVSGDASVLAGAAEPDQELQVRLQYNEFESDQAIESEYGDYDHFGSTGFYLEFIGPVTFGTDWRNSWIQIEVWQNENGVRDRVRVTSHNNARVDRLNGHELYIDEVYLEVEGPPGTIPDDGLPVPLLPTTGPTRWETNRFRISGTTESSSSFEIHGTIVLDFPCLMLGRQADVDPNLDGTWNTKAFPNPFVTQTQIIYSLSVPSTSEVKIFDVAGRHVRTLVDRTQSPGFRRVFWDGRDQGGRSLPTGIYFYQVRGQDPNRSGKLILIR